MTAAPRYGWYGDDFTGATDTLATLAERGLKAQLFLAVPTPEQLARSGPLDAVGIAGIGRTLSPAEMAAELEPVGRFFAGLGVRVLHYKCCSTFDSAPAVGSLGAAAAILRRHVSGSFLPIVGGQPSIGRYCLFSTLFAAAGTGGTVHRLDRHPTMSRHPVTPMGEADLRRHLAPQGMGEVAALHYPAYRDATGLPARLDALLAARPDAVLLDVAYEADLAPIGQLIWRHAEARPLLALGPSSVAQALAAAWGTWPRPAPALPASRGPVFVLAGSLSPVTRRQIAAATSYDHLEADPRRLMADEGYVGELLADVAGRLARGRSVLLRTAETMTDAAATGAVADATARFVARLMRLVPVARLGIAGGDTSSKAAQALGFWALSYETTLAPGVTLCRAHSDDPDLDGMDVMLKGGQMGPEDLLERLQAREPAAAAN